MENYKYVQNSRTRRKEDMVYVMGGQCQLCGYNKDIHALEFHHIDPSGKDFSFNKANCISWELIKNELQKCILVCANCHREIHSGLIQQELFTSFSKEKSQKISDKLYALTHHQNRYCKSCGALISYGAEYCVDCKNINRRISVRPEREEFKTQIRNTPFTTLSKQYGVSDNALRKWCDSMKLPRRKKEINQYTDDEWSQI